MRIWEKRGAESEWEVGNARSGSRIPNLHKVGEIEKNYTTLHNIRQSKKCKKARENINGVRNGIGGYGRWTFEPFCPFP